MARTKQGARKCTGGIAPRVVRNVEPGSGGPLPLLPPPPPGDSIIPNEPISDVMFFFSLHRYIPLTAITGRVLQVL
jgi:hypothetical protein